MRIVDWTWDTFYSAATNLATGFAGAGLAWLALRKKVSSDTAEIRESALKSGWLERLVKENSAMDERIESLRESQLNDAKLIATKDAEAKACRERMDEAKLERDLAVEELQQAKSRAAACDALVLELRDEALDYRLANGRLFKELAALDKDAAERLMVEHLRPALVAKPGGTT